MTDDTIPLFSFPAVQGKKVTAAFDGGRMSSELIFDSWSMGSASKPLI
jgi:hypothetical protein